MPNSDDHDDNNNDGASGTGGSGSPLDRINSAGSVGFKFTGNQEDDEPTPAPPPSATTGPTAPRFPFELPVVGVAPSQLNLVEQLSYIRLNDQDTRFPGSSLLNGLRMGARGVEADNLPRVRPDESSPYPFGSAPLVGIVTIYNQRKCDFLVLQAVLSNGYISVLTTFEAFNKIGLTILLHNDPGNVTISTLLKQAHSRKPNGPPPVRVELFLFDLNLLNHLRKIGYDFPMTTSQSLIQLPGRARPVDSASKVYLENLGLPPNNKH